MNYDLYKNIPLYATLWQDDFLPILEKSAIVANFPHNWLTPEIENALGKGDVEWVASSGTTSERMQIMRPSNWRQDQLNKTFNQHTLLKKCWDRSLTRIALTTTVCSQTVCFKADHGVDKRFIGRTLYINLTPDPQAWSEGDIERMLREIADENDYFLDADPYYLALFLKQLEKYQLEKNFVKPQAVTLGYELATANIRRYIEQKLNVPVINLYGSTELGYLLMEKEHGQLVLCSELTEVEFLPLESTQNLYSLIVSCVKNPYMPLVRYRTGDCVQVGTDHSPLSVQRICGREKEMIDTPAGTCVPHAFVDDLLAVLAPTMLIYQLQELGKDKLELAYTTFNDEPLPPDFGQLQEQLVRLLGKPCSFQHRQSISPSGSGKFCWLKKEGQY
ncbi:hypothetical protein LEAN103870_08245 [Legionella anisa]|uniref:CoF synthetase n=1 Tax=Legionella anisa TaxID=28082 RepID=A0AAX0WTA7_9GAMM|nr:hypothetical protein [Legionella anisa]AWN73186.1 hypothetical protein DLD14_04640 [Legionella anisa]KTC69458.1 Phenylacetate-coenzyme A ligase [Legionella anisa]MCW8424018.1 hypothetical protein [Legionella anisa]MCW8447540.1 hypothetical protein [Legionella anisa]PNL60304.1 hypothetical protein A6J39_003230 [Legionella anisa]